MTQQGGGCYVSFVDASKPDQDRRQGLKNFSSSNCRDSIDHKIGGLRVTPLE
jgi:hypothetical protein